MRMVTVVSWTLMYSIVGLGELGELVVLVVLAVLVVLVELAGLGFSISDE